MPDIKLAQLIRHRSPMLLLDAIISVEEASLIAAVSIREQSSFYRESLGVPAWIGMEYMAQAIAAFGGLGARARGEALPLGLLIGCREYVANVSHFAVGSELRIEITENVADTYGLGAFDCSIKTSQTLVTGRLSVFVQPATKLNELLA